MVEQNQKTKVKQTVNVKVNVGQVPTKAKRRRRKRVQQPVPMVQTRIIREPTMYNEARGNRDAEQGRLKAHEDLVSKQIELLRRFEPQPRKQHMVETAQQPVEETPLTPKGKVGRPRGSKNKPKVLVYATPYATQAEKADYDRAVNSGLLPMVETPQEEMPQQQSEPKIKRTYKRRQKKDKIEDMKIKQEDES